MSRAGLACLILLSALIGLVASVPLNERAPSAITRRNLAQENDLTSVFRRDDELTYTTRSFIVTAPVDLDTRAFIEDSEENTLSKREASPSPRRRGRAAPAPRRAAPRRAAPRRAAPAPRRASSPRRAAAPRRASPRRASPPPGAPRPRKKSIGERFRESLQRTRNNLRRIGNNIRTGFKRSLEKTRNNLRRIGHNAREGLKKVGRWFRTTGAKIAKVGLKIWSAVKSVASKVVKWIPIIGKPLSKGLKLASMATNAASNAIKVNLSPKLQKVMKVADAVRDPFGKGVKLAAESIAARAAKRAAAKAAGGSAPRAAPRAASQAAPRSAPRPAARRGGRK